MTNTQTHSTVRPAKAYKGIAMEGLVANWYARVRQKDDSIEPLVAKLSAQLPTGSRILEVAPGPGTLAIELARAGRYTVVGLDISKTFVEMAQTNAGKAGVMVGFRLGNASDMPLESGSFDFVVCRAAFKNFTQPVQAIQEMWRVLKPGGRAMIDDLLGGATAQTIDEHVKTMQLNPINAFITRWTFHSFLLKNAYTPARMQQFVAQTSFKQCDVRTNSLGMEIWLTR